MAKTLDDYAKEASRATSRWYGRAARFNEPPGLWVSCAEFFKEHWRQHPRTSPDGGVTIDNEPGDHDELTDDQVHGG